jgi:hypothetical protein
LIAYSPSSRQLSIGIRGILSEKSLTTWRGDVGIREKGENDELLRFDDETNPNTNVEGSKMGGSANPTLRDLMRKLEKLTVENNKIRRKAISKKTKGCSSSSEDEDSSLEEDVSKKGKKGRNNHDKPSYNSVSFNYDNMPITIAYTSKPIGKAP